MKNNKEKKYHLIYKTINLLNNKIYIGAHSTNNLNDNYIGSGTNLKKAVKKYGRENFHCEILFFCESSEKMLALEASIVNSEFIKNSNVYNLVPGGYGGMNKGSKDLKHMHNPITKEKCAVHYSAVEKMINEGWLLGRTTSSTTDSSWMYKDGIKKMIKKEFIEIYTKNGWIKGLPKSPTHNKIWINNPITNEYSLCNKDELEFKLSAGWIKKKWAPISKGTERMKIECPYCKKLCDRGNLNRWHNEKCRDKSS